MRHKCPDQSDTNTSLSMINSIVSVDVGAYAVYGSGGGSVSYNNVYNSDTSAYTFGGGYSAGTGGISQASDFNSPSCDGNPSNDDFTLKSTSPATDADQVDRRVRKLERRWLSLTVTAWQSSPPTHSASR